MRPEDANNARDVVDWDDDSAQYAPGTFGCHSLLHTVHVVTDIIDRHIAEHPAIKNDPEWVKLADTAGENLAELYQLIGQAHL